MTAFLVVTVTANSDYGEGKGSDPGELAAMADAIRYLQGLDKVYGQAARPRFGKRNYGGRRMADDVDSQLIYG